MPENIPIIELRIRNFEEQVHHAMMLRREEIEAQIEQGVSNALREVSTIITNESARQVSECVTKTIQNYFRHGEGARAIQSAISQMQLHVQPFTPGNTNEYAEQRDEQ